MNETRSQSALANGFSAVLSSLAPIRERTVHSNVAPWPSLSLIFRRFYA